MKKLLSVALAAVLAVSVAACSAKPASSTPQSTPASAPQSVSTGTPAAAKPTTDRAGKAITLPQTVNSIVTMAPSTTQLLCEMGLADKIVAIDTQSVIYAEGVAESVVKMDLMAPDVEQIVALKPDVVFTSTMSASGGADPFEPVRNAGICVVEIPSPTTVQGVYEDIIFIGDCVGESEKGKAFADGMTATFDKVKAKSAEITEKKTVFFEIACAPDIYSFGKDTFLNEMIDAMGGVNILADQTSWVSVTEESAVSKNPSVIFTNVTYVKDAASEIKARAGWKEVNAVKNAEVYFIDNGYSSLPNHHIADALVEMAKAAYPDVYKDF